MSGIISQEFIKINSYKDFVEKYALDQKEKELMVPKRDDLKRKNKMARPKKEKAKEVKVKVKIEESKPKTETKEVYRPRVKC